MFGFLCVSEIDQVCLEPYPKTDILTNGFVITLNPNINLTSIFSTNATVSYS